MKKNSHAIYSIATVPATSSAAATMGPAAPAAAAVDGAAVAVVEVEVEVEAACSDEAAVGLALPVASTSSVT